MWADPDRANVLCKIYNDRYNRLAPRTYDGSYLTFPGMNPDVEMRPHQRAAVARAGQANEGTLVAHVVAPEKPIRVSPCVWRPGVSVGPTSRLSSCRST